MGAAADSQGVFLAKQGRRKRSKGAGRLGGGVGKGAEGRGSNT